MLRRCEMCDQAGAPRAGQTKLKRLLVEDRLVTLCPDHAARVSQADVTSLEALRALCKEPEGRRSLLSRRSPLDRRVFPARPEGRRRADGRRETDKRLP
jgi:hypothetical protein